MDYLDDSGELVQELSPAPAPVQIDYESIFSNGYYPKPRGLADMLARGQLSKNGYLLMDCLFNLRNRYQQVDDWFFHSDKQFIDEGVLSSSSLIQARRELIEKKLIEIRKGNSHNATEYRILIPKQYFMRVEADTAT